MKLFLRGLLLAVVCGLPALASDYVTGQKVLVSQSIGGAKLDGGLLPYRVNDDGSMPVSLGAVIKVSDIDGGSLAPQINVSVSLGDGGLSVSVGAITVDGGTIAVTNFPALQYVAGNILVDGGTIAVNSLPPVVVSGGALTATAPSNTRTDTYTTAVAGTTVNLTSTPLKSFAMAVRGTGAQASTWNVVLEGSLDGTAFTTILTHTNTTGDGVVLYSGTNLFPSLYYRSRVVSLTLGSASDVVVTILGVQ